MAACGIITQNKDLLKKDALLTKDHIKCQYFPHKMYSSQGKNQFHMPIAKV